MAGVPEHAQRAAGGRTAAQALPPLPQPPAGAWQASHFALRYPSMLATAHVVQVQDFFQGHESTPEPDDPGSLQPLLCSS